MPIRTLIIVILAVAAISGCGRRGNLELPAAAVVNEAPATALAADGVSPLDPGSTEPENQAEAQPAPPPRRRFFLDFLL
jgi:predicted small lipoprotein YifL